MNGKNLLAKETLAMIFGLPEPPQTAIGYVFHGTGSLTPIYTDTVDGIITTPVERTEERHVTFIATSDFMEAWERGETAKAPSRLVREAQHAAWKAGYEAAQINEHEHRPGRKLTNPYRPHHYYTNQPLPETEQEDNNDTKGEAK